MKRVVLLGSTGSIGTSTAKVVEDLPDRLQLIGLAAENVHTNLGGTLLVDFFTIVPQVLQPGTTDFPILIPADDSFCNVSIYLQELILDPGASRGFAFTPGLELDLGI